MTRRRDRPSAGLRARSLALVAYGEMGASLTFALGIIALYALGLTPWVLLGVGALVLVVALSYAEGVAAMPERGGAGTFVRRAVNAPAGFATGWVLFLDYLVVIALAALFVPHYLGEALGWDALTDRPWDVVTGIGVVAALVAVRRVRGVRIYVAAVAMAAVALVAQSILAVAGFAVVIASDDLQLHLTADLGAAPTWGSLVLALSLGALAYTGLETVTNFAAEAREPGRTMPRSLFVGVAAVVVLNVAVAMVGVSAYPAVPSPDAPDGVTGALGTDWLRAPLVGVAAAIGDRAEFWARPLEVFVGVSSAFVLITAIATSMAGGERVAYAMARYRMLPHPFARPERGTAPSAAASVAGGVLAVLLLILAGTVGDGVRFLGSLYSFGVLAAFTAAQVAVVVLRAREPGLERPFRVPGNIHVRGVPIPVPAVVGATLTGALWVSALVTHDAARVAGPLWLAVGAVVYLVSRRIAGAGLLETTTPPVPDLVAGETRPVGRILVPLKLGGIGEEVMATALRLARETDAAVDVVHVVKVPMALPLDADLGAGREREAREEIDDAREIAGELGVAIEGRVVRARALAEAIVAEAVATGADLVVMGSSPRWRRHTRFFSPTVDEVLRRASCEVMVVAYPEGVIDDDLDMGQAPADEGRP